MKSRSSGTSCRSNRRRSAALVGLAASLGAATLTFGSGSSSPANAAASNIPPGAPVGAVEPSLNGGYDVLEWQNGLSGAAYTNTYNEATGIYEAGGEAQRRNCQLLNNVGGADDPYVTFASQSGAILPLSTWYTRCAGLGDKNDGGNNDVVRITSTGSSRWMGQYNVISNVDGDPSSHAIRLGYCAFDGAGHPSPYYIDTDNPPTGDYLLNTAAEKAFLQAPDSPILDYVMWKYGNTYDPGVAAGVWVVNHFILQDRTSGGVIVVPSLTNPTDSPFVNQISNDIYNEAVAKQGPWSIDVSLTETDAVITVTGPSGPIFNEEFNVTVTNADGPTTITTNGAGQATFPLTNANGTVTVEVDGIAPSPYGLLVPDDPVADQMLSTAGEGTPVEGFDEIDVFITVGDELPLSTDISSDSSSTGSTISDSLYYGYGDDRDDDINVDARVEVEAAILDASDNVVQALGSTTVTVEPGSTTNILPVEVPMLAAGQRVGYRHRRTGSVDDAGVFTPTVFPWSAWGIDDETADIELSDPEVVTQISEQTVVAGDTISDTFTVSGLAGAATADIELELVDVTDNNAVLGSWIIENVSNGTSSGHGSYTVPMERAGHTLVYRERVIFTGGDLDNDGTEEGEGDDDGQTTDWSGLDVASETTTVQISDPVVVTEISDQAAFPGATITDTFTVSGLVGPATADIELELVDMSDGEAVLGSWIVEDVTNGTTSGHGEFTVPVELEGHTLVYRERVIFTGADLDADGTEEGEGGDDGQTTDWSGLDVVSETTDVVRQPIVFTNTSHKIVDRAEIIYDTFTVADTAPGERLTVEVRLFDLTEDPTCSSEPLVTATVYGAESGDYTNVGRYVIRQDEGGHTFGYQERIVESNLPDRIADGEWEWSPCGASNESLVVRAPLEIATQVQDQTITLNDAGAAELVDIAMVSGLTPEMIYDVVSHDPVTGEEVRTQETIPAETATITAYLYGPFASLSAVECVPEMLAGKVSYTVDVDGKSKSPAITVTEAGIYNFVETIVSTDDDTRTADHECGEEAETSVVLEQPELVTVASSSSKWDLGEPVELVDQFMLEGMGSMLDGSGQAWSAEVALFGPFADAGSAECVAGSEVGTFVTDGFGDGTFLSDPFIVEEAGFYTFMVNAVRGVDGAVVSHDCALPEESVTIASAPTLATMAREVLAVETAEGQDGLLVDDVILEGLVKAHGPYTVEVDWFGPYPSDLPETWVCAPEERFGSDMVTADGDGTVSTPGVTVTKGGAYLATAVVFDADGTEVASHGCNEPNETVISRAFRKVEVITTGGSEQGWMLPISLAGLATLLAGAAAVAWMRRRDDSDRLAA